MAWMLEDEAASTLGISPQTVRRRVGNGSLRSMLQGSQLLVDVEIPCNAGRDASSEAGTTNAPPGPTFTLDLPRLPLAAETVRRPALSAAVPKLWLTAATLGAGSRTYGLVPTPAPAEPTQCGPRAVLLAGWLVALLVLGAAGAGWLVTRNQLGEVESAHRDALAAAEQARTNHEREALAQLVAANERESRLLADLEAARTRVIVLSADLEREKGSAAELNRRLDEAADRLGSLQAERRVIARKLAVAQTGMTVAGGMAALADSVRNLTKQLTTHPQDGSGRHVPDRLPIPQPADAPHDRKLPRPSPEDEDQAVSLRRIVPHEHQSPAQ